MKPLISPFLNVAALAAALCAGAAQAAIPAAERQALLDLYNSTSGWSNKTGWSTGTAGTECTWHGVTCSGAAGSEHVSGLDLHFNGISGNSAMSLTALTELQVLRLDQNSLAGPLPDIAGLAKLTKVDLHGNQFTGTIPSLAGLASLSEFAVNSNQLTGSTPMLSGLPQLKVFNAAGNRLNGAIGALAGAVALEEFYVQNNKISQTNDTGLTGPIPSLAGLVKLRKFDASNNRLDGITDLANLPVLAEFNASRNQLSGSIPPLTGLPKLYNLYLNDNALTGPIPNLTGLNELVYLHLQFNQLSGQIPASLTGLAKLTYFQIQNNQLVGSPPLPPASLTSSAMCPNPLRNSADAAINAAWDPITGSGGRPWGTGCTGSSDVTPIILDAAGNQVTDGSTGIVSPGGTQILPNNGAPFSFSLDAAPGYRLRPPVPSNCANSDLNGFTFTVSRLTANCNFEVTFVPDLAPGDEDGQCGPDHDRVRTSPPVNLCTAGTASTITFDSTANEWNWSCAGIGSGVTAQCYAARSGASVELTVTAVATGPGSVAPGTQTVTSGMSATVTATPDAGSHLAAVNGCGARFTGNTVTTAPVTEDCTVTLTFAAGTAPAVQPVPTLGEWALMLLATLVGGAGLALRKKA